MKKNETAETPRKLIIGIPRAMLFYRYEALWRAFFHELGVRAVLSRPTNKEIVKKGSELAIDEACLSTKIFLGHVNELVGKCDYILVPRVVGFGLRLDMCTKFQALYDVTANVFRNSGQKFLAYSINVNKKQTEDKAFAEMAMELGFTKKQGASAYKKAKKYQQSTWKDDVKAEEALYKKDGLKILVAAHSYVMEDPYIGKPVLDYLKEMDVLPIRADVSDRKEALALSEKVSPTLRWIMSREIVGSIEKHKDKIDGIVLLSAFPCGPDSMVNDMIIRKYKGIPILALVLDNQTGTGGLETRLESFVDILKFKKGEL